MTTTTREAGLNCLCARLRRPDGAGDAIAGFLTEIARGHDGSPYAQLGAAGGLAYVVAIVVQRVRS